MSAIPSSDPNAGGRSYLDGAHGALGSPSGVYSLAQSCDPESPKIKESSEDFVNGQIKVSDN